MEDFVSIDLSATVDGEDVPNAAAEGLSHEVGSGRLIAGLDNALIGLGVDESKVFTAKLATGEHAGQEAEVTVTVRSIKERELPERRRRVRPTCQRVRHHRRAAHQPRRTGAQRQARSAGRANPRRRAGRPARAGRRAGAGRGRAVADGRDLAGRDEWSEPGPGQVRRGTRSSRVHRATSSKPKRAPPQKRTSSGSCCSTPLPTN